MDISGKNILVTGGAGFIGSHLVDMLLKEDIEKVVVFDNYVRGYEYYVIDGQKYWLSKTAIRFTLFEKTNFNIRFKKVH